MEILSDLCRLCARKLHEDGVNVFALENDHLLLTINEFIPITINKDDLFPKNICSDCTATLNSFYLLRKRCLEAVQLFEECLISAIKIENPDDKNFDIKEEVVEIEFPEEPAIKPAKKRTKHVYSSSGPLFPTCGHREKTFQCKVLTEDEIRKFHDSFYATTVKVDQDAFLLKHSTAHTISKRKRRQSSSRSKRMMYPKLFISIGNGKRIPVCLQTFLRALRITKHRLQGVSRRFMKTGSAPTEGRGGDRKKNLYKARISPGVLDLVNKAFESRCCGSEPGMINLFMKTGSAPTDGRGGDRKKNLYEARISPGVLDLVNNWNDKLGP